MKLFVNLLNDSSTNNVQLGNYLLGVILGSVFVFLALAAFLAWLLRKKFFQDKEISKGNAFEKKMHALLNDFAYKNNYYYHQASLYKYEEKNLFEVDGILVTPFAIIVIEMKSINGTIRGKGSEGIWKKVLGSKSFDIHSPIMQNLKHIKHLERMLSFKVPLLSLIIFDSDEDDLDITDVDSYILITTAHNFQGLLDVTLPNLQIKLNPEEIIAANQEIQEHRTNTQHDRETFKVYTRQN